MVVNAGGADVFSTPGVESNPALILHGEQDIEIHRPFPPEAKLSCEGRIADIFDKGTAALLITGNRVRDETGEPLYATRTSLFLRGEGGFERPILHGLCSYGIVCKAVVDGALDGDVTRVARYQARFSGVAFPGETYVTSYWKEAGRILIEAKTKERDAQVISNACIALVSE